MQGTTAETAVEPDADHRSDAHEQTRFWKPEHWLCLKSGSASFKVRIVRAVVS